MFALGLFVLLFLIENPVVAVLIGAIFLGVMFIVVISFMRGLAEAAANKKREAELENEQQRAELVKAIEKNVLVMKKQHGKTH